MACPSAQGHIQNGILGGSFQIITLFWKSHMDISSFCFKQVFVFQKERIKGCFDTPPPDTPLHGFSKYSPLHFQCNSIYEQFWQMYLIFLSPKM